VLLILRRKRLIDTKSAVTCKLIVSDFTEDNIYMSVCKTFSNMKNTDSKQ